MIEEIYCLISVLSPLNKGDKKIFPNHVCDWVREIRHGGLNVDHQQSDKGQWFSVHLSANIICD